MNEHDDEPTRGLPGRLPKGERILWQGSPNWRAVARSLLLVRWVAAYFAVLALWGVVSTSAPFGAAITAGLGAAAVGILCAFAWAIARTTVYTITNRRVVLRFGVALSKCVNLPLRTIGTAALDAGSDGVGSIALALTEPLKLGYLQIWPHVRPLSFGTPVPLLRAVPDAARVGALLTEALVAVIPSQTAQPEPVEGRPEKVRSLDLQTLQPCFNSLGTSGSGDDTAPAYAHAAAA